MHLLFKNHYFSILTTFPPNNDVGLDYFLKLNKKLFFNVFLFFFV